MLDYRVRDGFNKPQYAEIGCNRNYETMAFHAFFDGEYWDADVGRQISFNSNWAIEELYADGKANDMHEAVVSEITKELENGNKYAD